LKAKQWPVQFGAWLIFLGGLARAEILPPKDDTSGMLTYNAAKVAVVTKRRLTLLNGTGTTLPVSKTLLTYNRHEFTLFLERGR
jgi:hypothetical protein